MTPEQQYHTDPVFRALVDCIAAIIDRAELLAKKSGTKRTIGKPM